MKKTGFIIISAAIIISNLSCVSNPSYVNKTSIDRVKARIAILPFQDFNSVEGNNSGELIRSLFELRLLKKGFNIIELEKTASHVDAAVLRKKEFSGKWIIDTGKKIESDYMILGSVHDYRIYQNLTSFLYLFSWLEVTASVGVTARMVSCKTGEVVWSGSFTGSSYTYNDAATAVVNTLIKTIKRKSVEEE